MNLKFLNSLKASYISCGENFTAVLTLDGGVFTFGAGMYGQLGHGQTSHEYFPRKIPDLMGSQVTQIACGRCHTLVYVSSSKRLYSFGLGGNGQLGTSLEASVNSTIPTCVLIEMNNLKNHSSNENKSLNIFNQDNLFMISAGGDQSFITCTLVRFASKFFQLNNFYFQISNFLFQIADNIEPLDYRHVLDKNGILNINVIEQIDKESLMMNIKINPSSKPINSIDLPTFL